MMKGQLDTPQIQFVNLFGRIKTHFMCASQKPLSPKGWHHMQRVKDLHGSPGGEGFWKGSSQSCDAPAAFPSP